MTDEIHERIDDETVSIGVTGSAALVGLGMLGLVSFTFLPIILGLAVEELDLGLKQAAALAFSEMTGSAIGAMVIFFFVRFMDLRSVALCGLFVTAAANLISAIAPDYDVWIIARLVAGVGSGLCLGIKSAIIASLRVPERLFGAVMAAGVFLAVAGLPAVSYIGEWGGIRYGLLFVGMIYIIGAPIVFWVPKPITYGTAPKSVASVLVGRGAWIACLSLFVFYFGVGTFWPFMERFGAAAGLQLKETGAVLGVSQAGAFGSALLVAAVGTRFGRLIPISLALSGFAVSLLLLTFMKSFLFVIASFALNIAWAASIPYLLGLLSDYDKRGRLAVLGIVMQTAGIAIGPAAVGPLVSAEGLQAAVWCAIAAFFVSWLGFLAASSLKNKWTFI